MSKFALTINASEIHSADPAAVLAAAITGELTIVSATPLEQLFFKCLALPAVASDDNTALIKEAQAFVKDRKAAEIKTVELAQKKVAEEKAKEDDNARLKAKQEQLTKVAAEKEAADKEEADLKEKLAQIQAKKLDLTTSIDELSA